MTMLCLCAGIMYLWEFTSGYQTDGDTCKNVDSLTENRLCQGRAAAGVLVVIAAATALFGGCSQNPERNQATVSSSFGLLNLARVVNLFTLTYIEKEQYAAGVANIVGALFGLGFALWTCKSGYQTNNLFFILSIAMYALAFAIDSWGSYSRNASCNNGIENEINENTARNLQDLDSCTTLAFQGVFALLALVSCMFAIVQICCQRSVQPKVQQFIICCSIGWIFAIYTTIFWEAFSNAERFGREPCGNVEDIDRDDLQADDFCSTMLFGGLISVVGVPLALISGLMFCLGCFVKERDEQEYNVDNHSNNYSLMYGV